MQLARIMPNLFKDKPLLQLTMRIRNPFRREERPSRRANRRPTPTPYNYADPARDFAGVSDTVKNLDNLVRTSIPETETMEDKTERESRERARATAGRSFEEGYQKIVHALRKVGTQIVDGRHTHVQQNLANIRAYAERFLQTFEAYEGDLNPKYRLKTNRTNTDGKQIVVAATIQQVRRLIEGELGILANMYGCAQTASAQDQDIGSYIRRNTDVVALSLNKNLENSGGRAYNASWIEKVCNTYVNLGSSAPTPPRARSAERQIS